MRRQRNGGAEQDTFSRWGRKYYGYLQRAGVRAKIKRQVNRRERREGKRIDYDG